MKFKSSNDRIQDTSGRPCIKIASFGASLSSLDAALTSLSRLGRLLSRILIKTARLTAITATGFILSMIVICGYWSSDYCQNREAVWLVKSEMQPAGLDFNYKAEAVTDGKSAIYCYIPANKADPVISFMVNTKTSEIGALKKR